MARAKLRVCASCELLFVPKENEGCPYCGFGHYSAHYVYGKQCYKYYQTQEPWRKKRHAAYDDILDQVLKEADP